jgi:hypothetical protein
MTNADVLTAPSDTLATPQHPLLLTSQTGDTHQQPSFHPSAVVLGTTTVPALCHTDIYIDDFMILAQRPHHTATLNRLLFNLHKVFTDQPSTPRRTTISASKLAKGEAAFSTVKTLLGWTIDTYRMTLQLPHHRLTSLTNTITDILHRSRVSRRAWQRLLGTLRSTSPALYGASHLFSSLQYALTEKSGRRLKVTALYKALLEEWLALASTSHTLPVPLHTVVPHPPNIVGATDASSAGMGGFWVAPDNNHYVWRAPFPATVKTDLITYDNPHGSITNSDLELAAFVVGSATIATNHPKPDYQHVCLASDNTPTVAWVTKGSTTSIGPAAYLLRLLAQQRRLRRYQVSSFFIPGSSNTIADCCSRSLHLADADFVAYMNATFPVKNSWTLVPPNSALLSGMNSALYRRLQPQASPPAASTPQILHGTYGSISVNHSTTTPSLRPSTTLFPSCNSSRIATPPASWLPAEVQCALARWKQPFVPLGRRWPHWATATHDYNHQEN